MSIATLIAENQPEAFAFTAESEAEIKQQLAKYPDGRQPVLLNLCSISRKDSMITGSR